MADEFDWKNRIPEFDIGNTSLPMFLLETAIEMDYIIAKMEERDENIQYLSQLLNNATQGAKPPICGGLGLSPIVYSISDEGPFDGFWKGRSDINYIAVQINLVSKDLRDFESLPKEQQKSVRDFCLDLSRGAMSHQMDYGYVRRLA